MEKGAKIITGKQVYSTERESQEWIVKCKTNPVVAQKALVQEKEEEEEIQIKSTHLVMALPLPQAIQISPHHVKQVLPQEIHQVAYSKCLVLMTVTEKDIDKQGQSGQENINQIVSFVSDNHLKGVSPIPFSFTIHSTHDFALKYWDEPDTIRIPLISKSLGMSNEKLSVCHRWGFSTPLKTFPAPYLLLEDEKLAYVGDSFSESSNLKKSQLIWTAAFSGLRGAESISKL